MELPRRSDGVDDDASDALRHALASVEPWNLVELDALFALETAENGPHHDDDENHELHDHDHHRAVPYPKRGPHRHREPRKQEALALQSKIASLQRTIEYERAKRGQPSATVSDTGFATEWREIAERQADQRAAALVENEKLRLAMAARASDARKIVRLGERVTQLEELLSPRPEVPDFSFDEYRGPDPDPRDQLDQLERKLKSAREVFGAADEFRAHGRESFSKSHFRSCDPDSDEGVEFEYLMGWLVPFGVREVADALWVQATRPMRISNARIMVIHEEPRGEVSRFIAPPPEGRIESLVHGQTATRRSLEHEEDGSIELLTDIRGRMHNTARGGLILIGHEWMRAEPVTLSDGVEGSMSRVQWCHRVRVRPPTYATMTRKERVAWIHRVVTGPVQNRIKRDIASNIQHIENLLLTPRDTSSDKCELSKAVPSK